MKKQFAILTLLVMLAIGNAYARSTFSSERIREAAKQYVVSQVPGDCEVEVLGRVPDKSFDSDNIKAEFKMTEGHVAGLGSLMLKFSEHGNRVEIVNLRIRVRRFAEVPVAVRSVSVGDYLYGAVEMRRMEITAFNPDEIASKSEIKTCVARKIISEGNIVMKNKITKGNVIKRGQQVDIVVISGPVQVYTSGMAVTDAAAGERCKVKRDSRDGRNRNDYMTGWAGTDGKVYVKAQ